MSLIIKKSENNSPQNEVEKRHKHFQGAITFLKKTKIPADSNKKRLFDLPWYLVIGDASVQKNKLLTNANLKFLLTKRNSKMYQSEQRHCDWWATRDATFLDVNPQYFYTKEKSQQLCWEKFLSLLGKHHQPALQGVIVAINLADIAMEGKEKQQLLFKTLKLRLQEIESILQQATPIYFLFNHSDCLTGFVEYHDDLSLHELQNSWGVSFNQKQIISTQRAADNFDIAYDHLLSDLNQVLIAKLHQQRSLEKRAKTKDFPLQVESLKRPLAIFIQKISPLITGRKHLKLRGIYFTSLGTYDQHVDRLLKPLKQSFELAVPRANQKSRSRNYFIAGIFKEVLLQDEKLFAALQTEKVFQKKRLTQRIAIGTAAVIVVAAIASWSTHFTSKMQRLNQAEAVLAQYKILETTQSLSTVSQQITALNLLSQAKDFLQQDNFYWFIRFDKQKRNDLEITASNAYQHKLAQLVTTELAEILQHLIASPQHEASVYSALKAYLMFDYPSYFNRDAVIQWLSHYINHNQRLEPKERNLLLKHIQRFAGTNFEDIALDKTLITKAQQYLQQTSPEKLTLAVLDNELLKNSTYILYKTPANGFNILKNNQTLTVPALYTEKYFRQVYDNLIPAAVDTLYQGNWITGMDSRNENSASLVNKTRALYIAQYVHYWTTLINGLQLKPVQNLNDAHKLLLGFITPNSPIEQLLTKIYQNTHINYENLPTPISIQFAHLDNFISQNNFGKAGKLQKQLSELNANIFTINQAAKVNAAAYRYTKQLVTNEETDLFSALNKEAENVPQPLQQWLQQTLSTTTRLLLQQTAKHIKASWESVVMSDYQPFIAPYYPVSNDKTNPLPLAQFNTFYGPKGKLLNYFTHYVSPFTVKQHNTLHWRQLNQQAMPLDDQLLKRYQQATIIANTMFNPVTAKFGMELAITPTAFGRKVKEIDIAINHQGVQFTSSKEAPSIFYWPNNNGNGAITITFVDKQGKQTTISETGPWALFKLLDDGKLEKSSQATTVNFTLTAKGKAARFSIISHTSLNPLKQSLLKLENS